MADEPDTIRRALDDPGWDLAVPPGAPERIHDALARRRRRRRGTLLAGVAVIVALVVAGSLGGRSLLSEVAGHPELTCPAPPEPADQVVSAWDWARFVRLGDRTYEPIDDTRTSAPPLGSLTLDDLGDRVGVVCYTLAAYPNVGPGFEPRSGDATTLPVGTVLRAVEGYDPSFRIGAEVDGELRVFDVTEGKSARTGADLFDIDGKVERLVFDAGDIDGPATVSDPEVVSEVVDAVLAAPLYPPGSEPKRRGLDVALEFVLEDGSIVQCGYFPQDDLIAPRLIEPPELQKAYDQARR